MDAATASCQALVHPETASCTSHWPRFFLVTLLRANAIYVPYYGALLLARKRLAALTASSAWTLLDSSMRSSMLAGAPWHAPCPSPVALT